MGLTIRDVAKAVGVSTATVSNVLNKRGKVGRRTQDLVLSTVKRLGYETILSETNYDPRRTQEAAIRMMGHNVGQPGSEALFEIAPSASRFQTTLSPAGVVNAQTSRIVDQTQGPAMICRIFHPARSTKCLSSSSPSQPFGQNSWNGTSRTSLFITLANPANLALPRGSRDLFPPHLHSSRRAAESAE
jgi:hypothetical protein